MVARVGSKAVSFKVAAHIVILRKARGWSQRDLSEKLTEHGFLINSANVSKLEASIRSITIDEAVAVAAAFDIPLDDLVSGACSTCRSEPPAGFRCKSCGAEG